MRRLAFNQNTSDTDDSGIWLSVGDLMSVLLMIFALLLVAALVQIAEVEEQSTNNRIMIIRDIQERLSVNKLDITFDAQKGEISLSEKLFFDSNQANLSENGQSLLRKFIPLYADVIFQDEDRAREVGYIMIEGHASSDGDFNHNMQLSVLRANSVSEFVQKMNFANKQRLIGKFIIAGRGSLDADPNKALSNDRNVKFRFQFKENQFLGNFLGVKTIE
jgi:outer membrane protein OmpA-like peptidoglycan-associated protein